MSKKILVIENRPSRIAEAKKAFRQFELKFVESYESAQALVSGERFDGIVDAMQDTLLHGRACMDAYVDVRAYSINKNIEYVIVNK